MWRESPTNLVAVSAFGLDKASTLAAAESLQVAGDDVWDELLSGTGDVRVPSSAKAGVTGGEPDGPLFVAYVDGDGSLCLDVETEDGSEGSCGGGDTGPLVVQVGVCGDGTFVVYGCTTLGTDGELLITADGGPAGSEAYYEGGTVFAFTVTADQIPAEVVVQGTDGAGARPRRGACAWRRARWVVSDDDVDAYDDVGLRTSKPSASAAGICWRSKVR